MSPIIIPIFSISALLMIISFLFSLQANVWTDALYRSSIVFIASFTLIYMFTWLIKNVVIGQTKPGAPFSENDVSKHTAEGQQEEKRADKEADTGKHINIQTPDDDEFIPFQPQRLSEDDWQKKERDN